MIVRITNKNNLFDGYSGEVVSESDDHYLVDLNIWIRLHEPQSGIQSISGLMKVTVRKDEVEEVKRS